MSIETSEFFRLSIEPVSGFPEAHTLPSGSKRKVCLDPAP